MLERRRDATAPLDRIAQTALEIGDLEFSSYARFLRGLFLALAGERVTECAPKLAALAEWVQRAGHTYPEAGLLHETYSVLLEPYPDLDRRSRQGHTRLLAAGDLPYVRTLWMMILCIHRRFDLALAHSNALGEKLLYIAPFVHVADHTFYRALACAALVEGSPRKTRRSHMRELHRAIRELRRWARNGPDFVHMAEILEAERARLRSDLKRAQSSYERAARRAKQQEFPHHAALALERCSEMLAAHQRDIDAAATAQRARALYEEWGARSKLTALHGAATASSA